MPKITNELLQAGASERGGFRRVQTELLGLPWPLPKGWKSALLGTEISAEYFEEFVRLSGKGSTDSPPVARNTNWGNAPVPVQIYIYVHVLQDECFYVGLTKDIVVRTAQHNDGEGAKWTKLHPPIRMLHSVFTGTTDPTVAMRLEDEMTLTLMEKYGIERVRGGRYVCVQQELVEKALRAHGVWDRLKLAEYRLKGFELEATWNDALEEFLSKALSYYDADAPSDRRNELFASCYKLTRYQYWRDEYLPCLGWDFWNDKGVLPVILSFKHSRPVASRRRTSFEVLADALQRGSAGQHPMRRLFLLTWRAFSPPTTENQSKTVERFMGYLHDGSEYDAQYDAFVSMIFSETRYLLRASHTSRTLKVG
jgi:predicted GIY-YIG superfamily endonuclease